MLGLPKFRRNKGRRERIYKLDESKILTKEDLAEIERKRAHDRDIAQRQRLLHSLTPYQAHLLAKRIAEKKKGGNLEK